MKLALYRKYLLGSTILVAGMAIAADAAAAQTQPDPAQAQNARDQGLGDIVVTATRRAETAQSVAAAITAVSAETLKLAAVSDLQGLTKGLVGVQYDSANNQRPELSIRGIYTNRFDGGANPSSGIFVDEIYQARFADTLSALVDVERIEVLRGPQGTLFGRNTIGGAISVFTADPTKNLSGQFSGTYGNKKLVDLKGSVSVPVTDTIGLRLAAGYRDRDGFMRDTVSGRNDGQQTITLRGKLVTQLTDNLTLKLSSSYYRNEQDALLGNPVAAPLALQGPQRGFSVDGDPFSGSYTSPGSNRVEKVDASARLTWEKDTISVTALMGWINFKQDPKNQDLDGAPNDLITYNGHVRSDTYSAELRLASVPGGFATFDDHFKWIAGMYFFRDDVNERTVLRYGADTTLSNAERIASGRTGFVSAERFNVTADRVTSVAIYGQGTFNLSDQLGLTLGGRYTRDKRTFDLRAYQISAPTFPTIATPTNFSSAPVDAAFNPKVGLEYRLNRSMLFYTSFSKGFKGGGRQSTFNNQAQASVILQPEKVDAYEIGAKTEFFDHLIRLNVAGFINKYSDLQVRRVVRFDNGTVSSVAGNAAKATIRGVEVEGAALLTPTLRVNASYAYLEARYDDYVADPTKSPPITLTGNTLPRAPKDRFNIDATYTVKLSGGRDVQVRGAYNYTGPFYFQPENQPNQKQAGYGLIDASITLNFGNQKSSLQFWGRNIGNTTYYSYIDPVLPGLTAYYGDRRTCGVTFSQKVR